MEFVFQNNKYDEEREDGLEPSPFQQALYESPVNSRRNFPATFEEVEFNPPVRTRRKAQPKPTYIGTTATTKKWFSLKNLSWYKAAWGVVVFLLLRLVFMENGILDYHKMNQAILDQELALVELRQENVELIKELKKIKTSTAYQKKMAREHLGVIAPNEYLVVFSR